MPTINPRINVTLSPSLDALVTRLAGLERISKSMVLRELLEAAEPALVQAVALIEAAKGASANARKKLATDLDSGIKVAEGTSQMMIQTMALHTRDLVSEAQAVRGRRPSRDAREASSVTVPKVAKVQAYADTNGVPPRPVLVKRPPSSNRGVKS